VVWVSFLNAQANRLIARFLPPVRLGFGLLADPLRLGTNLDFASWLDFAGKFGSGLVELWGMLDPNAQDFCQKQPLQATQWETRGVRVAVGTYADAFLWGASAVGIACLTAGGANPPAAPKISFSPYSSNLLQALVLPYPDVQTREGRLASAEFEVAAWRKVPAENLSPLAQFLLGQIEGGEKPQRVLVLGAGWGRDLLQLKARFPAWDLVGLERDDALAAIGRELTAAAGIPASVSTVEGLLPFADGEFDIAISLGLFSSLYERAARGLAKEVRRVTKGVIHHLEDGRGPDQGLQLKTFSLKAVYSELGAESAVQPVLGDGNPTGMYILKVAARP
jgi:hypothetical protein